MCVSGEPEVQECRCTFEEGIRGNGPRSPTVASSVRKGPRREGGRGNVLTTVPYEFKSRVTGESPNSKGLVIGQKRCSVCQRSPVPNPVDRVINSPSQQLSSPLLPLAPT